MAREGRIGCISPSPSTSKVRMVIPGAMLGCVCSLRGVPCRLRRVGSVDHSARRLRLSGAYSGFLCLVAG
jgi:hypothetical protein